MQKFFNLTDREAENTLRDNAAFRLFCGCSIIKNWHVPDHIKIEEFRSRLKPETQRKIANLIAVLAVKLKYANSAKLDIDSTVQEANISYSAVANFLVKIAVIAKRLVKPLGKLSRNSIDAYQINLKKIKAVVFYYFNLKRRGKMLAY